MRHYDEAEGYDDRERYLSESDTDDDEEDAAPTQNDATHPHQQQHHEALRSNQKALESLNTKTKIMITLSLLSFCCLFTTLYSCIGFLIWIDYQSSNPLPPPIATVIPEPINPKLLWEANQQFGVMEHLSKAEQEAEYKNFIDDDNLVDDQLYNSHEEDSDCLLGAITTALSQRNGKKKSKDDCKNKKRVVKSNIQYIVNALANMKSAAKYVLEKKIAVGAIDVSNLSFAELTYQQIFQRKVITRADYDFDELHTSHDAILNTTIDEEIRNSPPFEWLPLSILSPQQLQARERSRLQQINESHITKRMCDHILTRENERMTGETVERLTNIAQEKQMAKDIARQDKEARKLEDKRRKAGNLILLVQYY